MRRNENRYQSSQADNVKLATKWNDRCKVYVSSSCQGSVLRHSILGSRLLALEEIFLSSPTSSQSSHDGNRFAEPIGNVMSLNFSDEKGDSTSTGSRQMA